MNTTIIRKYIQVPDNLLALLSRYRVVIPGIQRHYVQGANNPKAESIREQFVKDIFNAIEAENLFHLHFIYGPIDTNGEDSFVPVDGQQRLTTLWLIARYAVEKASHTIRPELLRLLSRFTYEDRINAKRFCQALTSPDSKWDCAKDPNPEILRQDWFLDYWKEDETVASMIRMLSTIHDEWQKHSGSLTGEQVLEAIGSSIRFELNIDSFGDDIYMKMNARGLQLTQWENFKSKFSESFKDEDYKGIWERKMEELSNLFFTCSAERHELPDNSFFALYARIMAFESYERKYNNSIGQLAEFVHDTWQQIELPFIPYTDFLNIIGRDSELSINVARTCSVMIEVILNNHCSIVPYWGDKDPAGTARTLFDTFFHPKNYNDIDFSLCCYEYFKVFGMVKNSEFLKASRLIWNILENVSRQSDNKYNRNTIIQRFIKQDEPSLYTPKCKEEFISSDPAQAIEEAEKAVKMYDDNQSMPVDWNEEKLGRWIDWHHAIEFAENWAFFNGSIRFLYKNAQAESTWENFATKLCNCMDLFSANGLVTNRKTRTNKVLISHCESWEMIRRMPVFDARKENWKRILTAQSLSRCVNGLLLSPNTIVNNSDKIINVLQNDTIWEKLIKDISGYELEWKANSPSLWLNRYLYCTLKLTRENREDVLDDFIGNPHIHFEATEENRFLKIDGINYYYAVPVFFNYEHQGKTYRFAWQTWGWLDMYDRNDKLYDKYFSKYRKGFNIEILHNDEQSSIGSAYFLSKIEECIESYERFIDSLKE